jgi:predicted DNA-binding protein (MmcQ/YjbR family)
MPATDAFKAVQTYCMGKEGAWEDYPWEGHAGWKVKDKLFCIGAPAERTITVKSTPDKQQALVQHPHIRVAAYVGRYGWVSMDIMDKADCELAMDLIDESYDLVVKKKKR